MADQFAGKTALVTGAGSGIGKAAAIALAAEGARVVVNDVDLEAAQAVVNEISAAGGTAAPSVGDVGSAEDVKGAVATAVNEFGGLHLAFNNAGISGPLGLLTEIDLEGYRRVIDVNLNSVFYGMYYQIPEMLKAGGGAIVNTSSILGMVGSGTAVPYVTAKHGVTGMTRAAALGYADQGIRINSVHPGYIDTPLLEALPGEVYAALVRMHPAGRLGTADEVAQVVLFLLSDRAAFVTGAQYAVDGAYTTQ
ncbi:SDR family NAD(P)-dependent oxidoreductase [Arthrobacter sp. zg-Y820]|uniref:SDR family NAD(P)-dependent oxidoreductase n=1 Tax=unclassified Arthrobacter TaxID=235627 RepID=UPI001E31E902|nr:MULTISPECIES: SDR family NAD(P)-dependent oxidoreductase [unclassified Arthrobacter]MCC9195510.1 SDR family oxidoreductase [Arthrobacter sp. zg-Y820]MDK1278369.1 SDR family NAD(P)-dependent oxidoreductase [Arthrobacter sp. zg.Y820]MDK1360058.1 SDR family NAD(P)-dependent oxidoreductase [Arthrobacter sp. zg-Y1219]WIB10244.1 SDR family NAD(P)-dependent oxidoreductase [Arthrobacter sp. zg-Y820]